MVVLHFSPNGYRKDSTFYVYCHSYIIFITDRLLLRVERLEKENSLLKNAVDERDSEIDKFKIQIINLGHGIWG